MEQPKNRKLVAKNLVLAFVVFVILLLCVLAWFSSRKEATASGLSVKTIGSGGLEVSLDGGEHWSTKWSSDRVENEEGWQVSKELKKFASGGSLMQLLSGNGRDLYYPKNVDANGEAKNFEKISDDKAGDYCLEFEAYFRSENQCSVGLTGESKVEPYDLSETTRNNSFGFSPDYIAGAARVAFLQEDMNDPKTLTKTGLWIPNPLYHLTTTANESSKYVKMPDNYSGGVTSATGGVVTGDFPDDYKGKRYYLWTSSVPMSKNLTAQENAVVLKSMYSIPLIPLEGKENAYYCQFFTNVPEEGRNEQLFLINNSNVDKSWEDVAHNGLNSFISNSTVETGFDGTYWNFDPNNVFTLSLTKDGVTKPDGFKYDNYDFKTIYYNTELLSSAASKLVRFVYEPYVEGGGKVTFATPDTGSTVENNTNSVKLEEGTIVVTRTFNGDIKGMHNDLSAANPDFTSGNSSCDLKIVGFRDTNGIRSYKLQNTSSKEDKKYLSVNSEGRLVLSDNDNASYFCIISTQNITTDENEKNIHEKLLAYISKDEQGNQTVKYVTLSSQDGTFELSSIYNPSDTGYMIYLKISEDNYTYSFDANGDPETAYYYFNGETKAALVKNSEKKEYTTSASDCTNLVQLRTVNKDMVAGKTYYTGKMKVRIFAEGFDREAQKPMEKGKIKVNLQFTASNIS